MMNFDIRKMRILVLAGIVALVGGIAVWADSGSEPNNPATTVAATPASAAEDAAPCSCGGPKSYYLKKYGTIKPPAFQNQTDGQPQATPPVNPPSTGTGG
jgi:hypothetical protein